MNASPNPTPGTELDRDALRRKYEQERDKRLNPRKDQQWTRVEAKFSNLADDPHADPHFKRAPITEETEVVVIGGGFGGLLSAARLREQGIENFRIIDKAADFGGAWYWNRYPGVQCDVDAYVYIPLLEETGYIPSEKYAHGPEIFAHCQRIGRHFGLYERALFQTQIVDMRWNEGERRWIVRTDRDDVIRARFVISASGPLNRPQLPGVPGIADFKGKIFHTSRWDYAYTGGDTSGGLTGLADKKVALIGTGATGIQCAPYVAKDAKHLYIVQRTPAVVDWRGNRPTDPQWAQSLTPGWQKRRIENFEVAISVSKPPEDLVNDAWTQLFQSLSPQIPLEGVSLPELEDHLELIDFQQGERIRARVQSLVEDKDTAEGLKPWYRIWCKRPTFNDNYYPTFNRPNVTLVDTQGEGVERFTADGLVCNGREYKVDCVIFATGFEVGAPYTEKASFEVHGVDGRKLTEHYRNGLRTLHGFTSHGFPNFFVLGISQSPFTASFTAMLGNQSSHVVRMITAMKEHGWTRLDTTAEAEAQWQEVIREKAAIRRAFWAQCTPGYYNGQTQVERGFLVNVYWGPPPEYDQHMAEWFARGDWRGLTLD